MSLLKQKTHLILDLMGGDLGIDAPLEGVLLAYPELNCELTLIGDETKARAVLSKKKFSKLKPFLDRQEIKLIHTSETIEMSDTIQSIRSKKDASINIGCRMVKESFGRNPSAPVAFISAGHSGAIMASALLNLGRIKGIERPAIAVTLPTLNPRGCVFLDVGANVDCKPEHLRDFAWMGSSYASAAFRADSPIKIGLLSNGEERSKGNDVTLKALEMIEKNPPPHSEFVGYVEGKEIFKGTVDVVVVDGFVGNVVLKSLEGLGSTVSQFLSAEARSNPLIALGFFLAQAAFRRLKRKLDYAEYGAAPLLGVNGAIFICHGRSNKKAFKNALLRAKTGVEGGFVQSLMQAAIPDRVPDSEPSKEQGSKTL